MRPNDQTDHADGPSVKLHKCLMAVQALTRALLAIAVLGTIARVASALGRGPRWAHKGHGHDGAGGHRRGERCEECRHERMGPREWHRHRHGERCEECRRSDSHEGHDQAEHFAHHGEGARDAFAVLDERFARGEIDAAEYVERRDLLRQTR